jgi:hypothetical protein
MAAWEAALSSSDLVTPYREIMSARPDPEVVVARTLCGDDEREDATLRWYVDSDKRELCTGLFALLLVFVDLSS